MERETKNKKREREEEENKTDCFAMKSAKTWKREIYGDHQNYYDHTMQEESDESYISCDVDNDNNNGKYVGLGVFDFPWLHSDEGMIWESDEEYWNIPGEAEVEYNRQWLYESPRTPWREEMNVWELEMESVDCIWSWMVNEPVEQGNDA